MEDPTPAEMKRLEALMVDGREEAKASRQRIVDAASLTTYFMGFWQANHAAEALKYLERLELKRNLRALQEIHGCWKVPPDLGVSLQKRSKAPRFSSLPDSSSMRNLKYVLKFIGCSLHENRPYKQFLNAKSTRQKRYWLHKYQGPKHVPSADYKEPLCPLQLKRLHYFFPHQFVETDGKIYFNGQHLTYDENKNLMYLGRKAE